MKGRMQRLLRTAALLCMAAVLLCGTASANSAPPDYLLAVKVVNGPEEPYELKLLPPAGMDDSNFYMNQDTENENEDGTYLFSHPFMSDQFRILISTKSGDTWTSDVLERRVVQDAVRVDWATKKVSMPPIWLAVVLQTISTLLPTLAVEGWLLLVFRFDWKRNWKPFLLVNLATQGALAVFLSVKIVQWGAYYASVFFGALVLIPIELVIAFVEAYQYSRRLQGRPEGVAFAYGLTANAASYLLGVWAVPLAWTCLARVLWMGA